MILISFQYMLIKTFVGIRQARSKNPAILQRIQNTFGSLSNIKLN
jgi:hypothetical protein